MKQTIEGLIYHRMDALKGVKGTYDKNEWEAHKQGAVNTIDSLMDNLLEAGTLSQEDYQGLDDLLDTLADMPY